MARPKTLLAGNWKMNLVTSDIEPFYSAFGASFKDLNEICQKVDIAFGVPFTLLAESTRRTAKTPIHVAAQNVHGEDFGAFTGEVSIPMLKDVGIDWAIVGHSERRLYFNETDLGVAKKVKKLITAGMTPIACVGESREEREAGITDTVVSRQVSAILEELINPGNLIVAYEPVWAIGTGLTATNEQAQEVHAQIRGLLTQRFGEQRATTMRILYGGSAKPSNIAGLLAQPDINGGLVGGASLKPADFASMVQSAYEVAT